MKRAAAALAVATLSIGTPRAAGPTATEALQLAQRYLATWHETLTNLVADELYDQEVSPVVRSVTGADQPLRPQSRRLQSEVLLIRSPADNLWLSFRDVMRVDGVPVPDRQRRFSDLFESPTASVISTAGRMAQESARYNLGRLVRTTNTPTAALVFLQGRHAQNSHWSLDRKTRLEGRPAWTLCFEQRKPPYAIQVTGASRVLPPTGCFWLEPSTGVILQTEIAVRTNYFVKTTTRYGRVTTIDGRVPVRMSEEFNVPGVERGRGVATYANHRLFRTGARVIGDR